MVQLRLFPRVIALLALGSVSLSGAEVVAAPWVDVTAQTIGVTGEWSNKVELADIDGDGRVDLLFANGRGYASDGGPERNRVFLNQGAGASFLEVSEAVMGAADRTRVIKARDVDGDGVVDLFVGNTWQTQSRLLLGQGGGTFKEVTATHLPQRLASVGDAELGDVDGDGDLDLVLADWGAGDPSSNEGGPLLLWLNEGGVFVEAALPAALVRWSWELELVDVDGDLALDVALSCKSCTGSSLLLGDGAGGFVDASTMLPQFSNNYDFEAMDLTGDGFVELITINDKSPGTREHVLSWQPGQGFVDVTEALLPEPQNLAGDDNMAVFLDVESDGDVDVLIAGLAGSQDRLLLNDGAGGLTAQVGVFEPAMSPGTLGIAVADLNGDGRLDVVMAEGELAEPDKVYFGEDVPVDSRPPLVVDRGAAPGASAGEFVITGQVHDRKTPVMPHDFQAVVVEVVLLADASTSEAPMRWVGGDLWRAAVAVTGASSARICATDAVGNRACTDPRALGEPEGETTSGGESSTGDAPTSGGEATLATGDGATATAGEGDGEGGCGCRSTTGGSPLGALGLVGLVGLVGWWRDQRRRRRPSSASRPKRASGSWV
jgi:hypothetical protein